MYLTASGSGRRWCCSQPPAAGPISQGLHSSERTIDIEKPQGRGRIATAVKGCRGKAERTLNFSDLGYGPDLSRSNETNYGPEWQRARYHVRMASRTLLESQGSRSRAGLGFCNIGSV